MNRKAISTVATLAFAVCGIGYAATRTVIIDTALLPTIAPGSVCLRPGNLGSHACEPIAALVDEAPRLARTNDDTLRASDIIELCAAHGIRDAVCGEAAALELHYHPKDPCWTHNKC
jgi:hypothetical protein